MLLAHGVGTRTDLPVPTWLAASGAGLAVLISFGALTLLWRKPMLDGDTAGWPIPRPVASVLDSTAIRHGLRVAAMLLSTAVCLIGFFGPTSAQRNLTPWAFYVTFWVGLVPASLLLGPVWRGFDPPPPGARAAGRPPPPGPPRGGGGPSRGARPPPRAGAAGGVPPPPAAAP